MYEVSHQASTYKEVTERVNNSIKILFTDLDGTLLNSAKRISSANLESLEQLGQSNIVRVISTGRSLFSYRSLQGDSAPVDYLVFSNGAGILDLKTDTLLYSSHLEQEDIRFISSHLSAHKADFMVHNTVPDNHFFTYFRNQPSNPDFTRRIEIYRRYAEKQRAKRELPKKSAQIIAIFPEDIETFKKVKEGLSDYQVTRTTSPLDNHSIWMEIYPKEVSKGKSAEWLCNHLNLNSNDTLGIGNDYNDISLLEFTRHSYLVANGPEEMRGNYLPTLSNDDDGFRHALLDAKMVAP